MAAGTSREHRHVVEDPEIRETAPPRRRRRWVRRLGIFVLLLLVLAWFLPAIVARTPLLEWIANRAAKVRGTITVRSARLGWFSTPVVGDVEIVDQKRRPVLQIPALSGNRTLWDLLRNWRSLGQFQLERPKVHVVLGRDKSNLEEVFAYYFTAPSSDQPVAVQVKIVEGEISITDEVTGGDCLLQHVNLTLDVPAEATAGMKIQLTAEIADPQRPGKLTAEGTLPASSADPSASAGVLNVTCENFPLPAVQALLQRFLPQTQIAGRLNSEIQCHWGEKAAPEKMVVEASVAADGFVFTAPDLGTESLRLARLQATGRIVWSPEEIAVEKATVDADLGRAELTGRIRRDGRDLVFSPAALLRQPFQFRSRIDLARLAALLPGTLRIRKGMAITAGEVQMAFESRPADAPQSGMAWHGRMETARLAATNGSRQITWDKPVSITFDAHDTPQGPVVDGLQCDSEFFKVHAAGSVDQLSAELTFHLEPLAAQLGQFVDLSTYHLAGEGGATLSWKRDAQGQFETGVELQLDNLYVVLPDARPWREEKLTASLAAKGRTDFTAQTHLDAGMLEISAGGDRLSAELQSPVVDLRGGGTWPIRAALQGQLQNWLARAALFLPLDGWGIAGHSALNVQAVVSKDRIKLEPLELNVDSLAVASPWVNVREPQVKLSATGSWDVSQRRLELTPAQLATTAVALTADRFLLALPPDAPMELSGTVRYQGDLGRLRLWLIDPGRPPSWALDGQLVGEVQFRQSPGLIQFDTTADVNNLTVVDASGSRFQEPRTHLVAAGAYETAKGVLRLEKVELASTAVAASVLGRFTTATEDRPSRAEVNGQVNYDLNRLCAMFRPYLSNNIHLTGQGTGPLAWQGPLSLAQGQAAASVEWQSAYLYGFQIGPGQIKPTLAQGMVQVEPLDLPVSQGRLLLNPKLRMAPEPMELTLPAGPVVKQVQITPAVCATFLKYIAPVLAEVTAVQGSFSLDLQDCRLPIRDPARGEIVGRLTVHTIEIGPGPLIRELAILLGREIPAKLRREAVIPFKMADGRVHHQGMELMFPNFTVRTSGSVGLEDQSLQLTAEMPVPPKWLENNPLAPTLRNQVLRIPIAGTLKRPTLDRQRVQEFSRQFLRKAAGNLLEDELGKQLDRLFKPKEK